MMHPQFVSSSAGRRAAAGILFLEDFEAPDLAPADHAPAPAEAAPAITPEDLAAAHRAGHADGFAAGLARANASHAEATLHALRAIAASLDGGRADLQRSAEAHAACVARLLTGALSALFPALCRDHGAAEAAAVARAILPALPHEPRVTVRVAPGIATAIEAEIARLDAEHRGRVVIEPAESAAPGDIHIAWREGVAVRDAATLWRDVAGALTPLGLPAASSTGDRA